MYGIHPTTLIIKANSGRFVKTSETNKLDNENMGGERIENTEVL